VTPAAPLILFSICKYVIVDHSLKGFAHRFLVARLQKAPFGDAHDGLEEFETAHAVLDFSAFELALVGEGFELGDVAVADGEVFFADDAPVLARFCEGVLGDLGPGRLGGPDEEQVFEDLAMLHKDLEDFLLFFFVFYDFV